MMYKKEYQEGGAMRFNPPKGDMAREMASQQGGGGEPDEAAMAAQEQMQMFGDNLLYLSVGA